MKKLLIACGVGVALVAGCGSEADDDASKSGQSVDKSPARVIAMPDKFRNIAHKCDGVGHRVYSNSTGDSGTGAQLFVIADPSCDDTN
jgi:hypothetical protein